VSSLENLHAWTKAGVMMRASLGANAAHATMLVSTQRGLAYQRRPSAGAATDHTAGASATTPYWVRLQRSGNVVSAYQSANGSTWVLVDSATISLPGTILVGLAVTSHADGSLATATFDSVSVTTGGTAGGLLPAGWESGDIGDIAAPGSASESDGTFTVRGSGEDIWGVADELHFAYQPLEDDGAITARVASVQHVDQWSKAGVMMRASLEDDAAHATMLVSAARGLAYQRRPSAGAVTDHTAGAAAAAAYWVRLERDGDTIEAYQSANGSTWTLVDSATLDLPPTIFVGLAVTSHADGSLAAATFDSVIVTP
jgi:regulation of enolase protein 1 (concanavalin A-like superfamily)